MLARVASFSTCAGERQLTKLEDTLPGEWGPDERVVAYVVALRDGGGILALPAEAYYPELSEEALNGDLDGELGPQTQVYVSFPAPKARFQLEAELVDVARDSLDVALERWSAR